MPVYSKLSELLSARQINQTQLQLRTGLAYSTISDLYHNKTRRVDLTTLDALCIALECSVGDLLQHASSTASANSSRDHRNRGVDRERRD